MTFSSFGFRRYLPRRPVLRVRDRIVSAQSLRDGIVHHGSEHGHDAVDVVLRQQAAQFLFSRVRIAVGDRSPMATSPQTGWILFFSRSRYSFSASGPTSMEVSHFPAHSSTVMRPSRGLMNLSRLLRSTSSPCAYCSAARSV